MIQQILTDALFAAIAAVGFAAISRPPARAYLWCALIAAIGHSARMVMISYGALHIAAATTVASFLVGILAVFCSPIARTPAETCLFPALLPMIPGVYAYKAFGGLAKSVLAADTIDFHHYFILFAQNALVCLAILLGMVIGATLPIFIFKDISFRATR